MLVAASTGRQAGDVSLCLGDVHLYVNHEQAAETQLAKETSTPPRASVERVSEHLMDVQRSDLRIIGYHHAGRIAAPLS